MTSGARQRRVDQCCGTVQRRAAIGQKRQMNRAFRLARRHVVQKIDDDSLKFCGILQITNIKQWNYFTRAQWQH
jgi:hypothetical protein